jgi:NAD-dependent dihydropyrimidine dehydrogenase PreA subunit
VARDIAAECMCLDWGPDGVAGFQISLKQHVTLDSRDCHDCKASGWNDFCLVSR